MAHINGSANISRAIVNNENWCTTKAIFIGSVIMKSQSNIVCQVLIQFQIVDRDLGIRVSRQSLKERNLRLLICHLGFYPKALPVVHFLKVLSNEIY